MNMHWVLAQQGMNVLVVLQALKVALGQLDLEYFSFATQYSCSLQFGCIANIVEIEATKLKMPHQKCQLENARNKN